MEDMLLSECEGNSNALQGWSKQKRPPGKQVIVIVTQFLYRNHSGLSGKNVCFWTSTDSTLIYGGCSSRKPVYPVVLLTSSQSHALSSYHPQL